MNYGPFQIVLRSYLGNQLLLVQEQLFVVTLDLVKLLLEILPFGLDKTAALFKLGELLNVFVDKVALRLEFDRELLLFLFECGCLIESLSLI